MKPTTTALTAREPVEDALRRLEERLDRASQAAERLLADAVERVSAGRGAGRVRRRTRAGPREAGTADEHAGKPPPAGWQQPGPERGAASPLLGDGDLLLGCSGRCATGSRPSSSSGSPRRCARCCSRCGL